MSLDIHQLTAYLPRERRIEVLRAYRQQAKHDTTAFLFCFFLGTIGAHRLYLHQWGAAVPRLVLGAIFLIGLGVGIIAQVPVGVLAVVLAALFIVMLAWEIADLFGIDAEVDRANQALAQRLLAAQPASAAVARPATQVASAPAGIGVITASDIAGALALADGVSTGRLQEDSSTLYAPTEDTRPAGDMTDAHPWPGSTHPIADAEAARGSVYVQLPSASPAMPAVPPSMPPSMPSAPPAGSPALEASAGVDHTDAHSPAPRAHPIADVEAVGAAVIVSLPQSQAPALTVNASADLTDAHPHAPQARPVGDIEAGASRSPVYVDLPGGQAPTDDEALVMFVPREEAPAADAGAANGTGATPWGGMMPSSTATRPSEPAVPPADYLPPTVGPTDTPAGGVPVWPVASTEAAAPPVWPVAPPAQADAQGESEPATLAELATLGGAAGLAGAVAHDAPPAAAHDAMPDASLGVAAEPTMPLPTRPEPAAAVPTPPTPSVSPAASTPPATPMKRVRVVRRIVLEDGGVVRELVAERIVPMDADSQAVAAELEEQLGHATPEEIAQLANLPGDTPIVVRSRVESGPLSGKLKPTDEQTPPTQGGN